MTEEKPKKSVASGAKRGSGQAKPSAEQIQEFAAPVYDVYYPTQTWNEILPGLTLGGTDSHDDMANLRFEADVFGMPDATVTKEHFDTVVTLYAWAKPADWFVKELRLGILDGDLSDFDWDEMRNLVLTAHGDWKAGKRVLIRCQAGINRSSLVMALVLIREGFSAKRAIELMRQKRGQAVLANRHFVEWLNDLDVRKWRE
jgi:hypothetical protein